MALSETHAHRGALPIRAADLVADRSEVKFLLGASDAPSLALSLGEHLSPSRGAGEQELTTIYFDTEHRELYRAALSEPIAVKVRVRGYRAADAAGLAALDGVTGRDPGVFVELKVREGARSRKRRVQLRLEAALALIEQPELAALHGRDHADRAALDAVREELARLRAQIGPLHASCAVRYRRLALEAPALALRVTFDRELCAFAQGRGAASPLPAGREPVSPAYIEPACVVEVKSRGSWPTWLAPTLAAHGARPAEYSKFVMASRAVHGLLR